MSRIRTINPNIGKDLGKGQNKGTGKTRNPTKNAKAQRGIELDILRKGTPLQAECFLQEMEKKAEISSGIQSFADDILLEALKMNDESLDEELTDCDLDYSDEDVFSADDSRTDWQTAVSKDGIWEDQEGGAFEASQKFEIFIHLKIDGTASCSINKNPRIGFDSASENSADKQNEFASRYEVLERLGIWLAEKRKSFLKTGDFWEFAEVSLKEAKVGKASVIQKDFIAIANLRCNPSSFSRFIQNVIVSSQIDSRNDDGTVRRDITCFEIGDIFSDKARYAWVARAFYDYCLEAKLEDEMAIAMKFLISAKADKNGKAERKRIPLSSLTNLGEVASRLCELVDVKSSDVVSIIKAKIQDA